MPFVWTDAALDLMFRLYVEQGLSASQTAGAMGGGLSRNAVLGKAQRMGWSKPERRVEPRPVQPKRPRGRPSGTRRWRPPSWANQPLPPLREAVVEGAPRLWTERVFGECPFPVGEPTEPGQQLSCCAPTGGATYCAAHYRLMRLDRQALSSEEQSAVAAFARRAA